MERKVGFYQEKIKKLLNRSDVGKCLVGKQVNRKGMDF
jgi:hypothetical protein